MDRRRAMLALLAVCLVSPLLARAQRTAPNTTTTLRMKYSITGNLRYEDTNRGADMVIVNLKVPTSGVIATSFTNSNGDFAFGNLDPGSYIISVEVTDYLPVEERVDIYNGSRPGVLIFLKRPIKFKQTDAGATVSTRQLKIPHEAEKWFNKAEQRISKNDLPGSIPLFQRAIAQYPDYYEAYFRLGVVQMQLRQTAESEQSLRKAIELGDSHFPEADFALGALLSDEQKFSEAETVLRKGLELQATSFQGHYQLARALFGENQVSEAEKHAQDAAQLRADYAPLCLLLANIHIRKKDYPSLKTDLEHFLKLDPNGPMSDQVRQMLESVDRRLAQAQPAPADAPTLKKP